MLATVTAGLRTVVLVPIFVIYTLVLAAIILVYGAADPTSPLHDKILRHWADMFLKIPPCNVSVSGINNIDQTKRYVVVANHLSQFDIPALFQVLPLKVRFLAKKELFRIPIFGRAMRTMGIIEIDRSAGRSSRRAISDGVQLAAQRGYSLMVFPEGTRSTTGELLPFKKGAFRIAIDTGLPVLPVVIEGTDLTIRPRSKLLHRAHAHVRVLDPIETSGMTNKDDLTPLFRAVEASIGKHYAELREINS